MLAVPMAIVGALIGLYVTGMSINIYSQIGIVMLIGLAAKNGILIVEFANQLRDSGVEFKEAVLRASRQRLRPIVMTAFTTHECCRLFLAQGRAESQVIGKNLPVCGIGVLNLFVIPALLHWLRRPVHPWQLRASWSQCRKSIRTTTVNSARDHCRQSLSRQ